MASWPWYHGQMSRMKAEEELLNVGHDGSFLVRDSESMAGAYALCVLYQGKIHQYRIMPSKGEDGTGYIIKAVEGVQQQKYSKLDDLIKGYGHDNNGLACGLTHPVRVVRDDGDDDPDTDDDDDKMAREGTLLYEETVKQFHNRLSQLNVSELDNTFVDNVKTYVHNGLLKDIESVQCGSNNIPQLHHLIAKSARDFQKQMDIFQTKLNILGQLFDEDTIVLSKPQDPMSRTVELDGFLDKLPDCRKSVKDVEKQAFKSLQEVCKSYDISQEEVPSSPNKKTPSPCRTSMVPPVTFEVKGEGFKPVKMKLIIDITYGTLQLMRTNRDSRGDDNATYVYNHDKILQLIKSRSHNTKLIIKVDSSKRKEFTFENVKNRETFCQLVQQMKNMHSQSNDIDQLQIFIGTWNMGDAMPNTPLQSWLRCEGSGKSLDSKIGMMPHDLYVIGTQESALSERDWVNKLKKELHSTVNVEFNTIAVCSLWQMRLVVLAKPEHIHRISHVEQSTVKTGIANTLGNKGAVAIAFHFNGTSMCFINSHLTSGNEKCVRRNQNFFDILKGLQLGQKDPYEINTAFHYLFWFGDLNYRLDGDVQGILRNICENKYEELLQLDQLKKVQRHEQAFTGFCEEGICFPPTYRYRKGRDKEYVWEKVKKTGTRINVPSWCDRVLWRSYPELYMENMAYGCTNDILNSDHHPVFSSFDVAIISQYVSYKENVCKQITNGNPTVNIIFKDIEARMRTKTNNNKYCLEFHSSCLESKSRSSPNRVWAIGSGYHDYSSSPRWTDNEMKQLKPILPFFDYLEDQHILIAVKSVDSDEYYGECVVALKSKFATMPVSFKGTLRHQGEITGELKGQMHIKTDEKILGSMASSRRGKSYELVLFDEGNPPHSSSDPSLRVSSGSAENFRLSPAVSPNISRKNQQEQSLGASGPPIPPLRRSKESKSMYDNSADDPRSSPKIPPRQVPDLYVVGQTTYDTPPPPKYHGKVPPTRQMSEPAANIPYSLEYRSLPSDLEEDAHSVMPKVPPRNVPDMYEPSTTYDTPTPLHSHSSNYDVPVPLPNLPPPRNIPGRSSPFRQTTESVDTPGDKPVPPHGDKPPLPLRKIENPQGTLDDDDDDDEDDTSYFEYPPGPPLPQKVPLRPKSPQSVVNTSLRGLPPLPPRPHQQKQSKQAPPPVPPMPDDSFIQTEDYEALTKPKTISEWLLNLSLPQYINNMMENGWDSVDFIDSITDDDLAIAGVTNYEHRQRILKSIFDMKRLLS